MKKKFKKIPFTPEIKINYGLQDCSKCANRIRCDECSRSRKAIGEALASLIKIASFPEGGCGAECVYVDQVLEYIESVTKD